MPKTYQDSPAPSPFSDHHWPAGKKAPITLFAPGSSEWFYYAIWMITESNFPVSIDERFGFMHFSHDWKYLCWLLMFMVLLLNFSQVHNISTAEKPF